MYNAHQNQSLKTHLEGVAEIASNNASKIGLQKAGELIGLLHDIGKYSESFQNYIGSAIGTIDQDADEYVNAGELKGHIDHSSAGAQFIWNAVKDKKQPIQIAGQMLSLCLTSHHSGLIDCISPIGENVFSKRMIKQDDLTHFSEVLNKIEPEITDKLNSIIREEETLKAIINLMKAIAFKENSEKSIRSAFQYNLMIRMLFSCLIDADRLDSSDAENPGNASFRQSGKYIDWKTLTHRLENHLLNFENKPGKNVVDTIRQNVSEACLQRANDSTGVFTLTVPTGGGKTLSSLRFALNHACQHNLERIIYVIPFTSIIDQNAQVVREILEVGDEEKGRIVLEHHSNLVPEVQNWKNKILSENWDAPVIFTTTVQFLDSLFSSGTRGARRMHQLANTVIIFDEIQALPLKTVHMFCNAVNYLINFCHSSVVLCSATQPLLNMVSEEKGRIWFGKENEIMPDVHHLFSSLKRVEVHNLIRPKGWNPSDIAVLAEEQVNESGSCLVIVNTKKNARAVFESCSASSEFPVFHLSTSMCAAHRMEKLTLIRQMLEQTKPLICVSTQLIEAGVDVDFGSVIRFVAGLDSVAQAAGRCNRNGKRLLGKVLVINPADEVIDSLLDIKVGKEKTERIFREMMDPESGLPSDIIHPIVLDRYFRYYFHDRASEMSFSISGVRDDTLLNMLGINGFAVAEHNRIYNEDPKIYFRQSFQSAAEAFRAIDAPTIGIIVPFQKGEQIIAGLFSQYAVEQQFKLLRKAQRFTVNVFPNVLKKLMENKAVKEVPEIGVLTLCDPRYYHPEFGLGTEIIKEYDTQIY